MTKIIDGYAQPDVYAKKNGRDCYVFVEDALSIINNEEALIATIRELIRTKLSSIGEIRIEVV